MSLRLQIRLHRGATVVGVTGVADERVLHLLREAVRRASLCSDLVVVELDQLTLVEVGRLRDLITALNEAPRQASLRLVARRTSATALLVRWRIHHVIPIHRSVDDAITVHRVMGKRVR